MRHVSNQKTKHNLKPKLLHTKNVICKRWLQSMMSSSARNPAENHVNFSVSFSKLLWFSSYQYTYHILVANTERCNCKIKRRHQMYLCQYFILLFCTLTRQVFLFWWKFFNGWSFLAPGNFTYYTQGAKCERNKNRIMWLASLCPEED